MSVISVHFPEYIAKNPKKEKPSHYLEGKSVLNNYLPRTFFIQFKSVNS
jgi:hypothetical protein